MMRGGHPIADWWHDMSSLRLRTVAPQVQSAPSPRVIYFGRTTPPSLDSEGALLRLPHRPPRPSDTIDGSVNPSRG